MIASGGTDFFLAGKKRIIENGAMIGVHSWDSPGESALDLPKDNEEHQKYLSYYNQVGIPAEFYWFTLKAAPPEDIHFMTDDEITKFQIKSN
jgi:hypothetical protein